MDRYCMLIQVCICMYPGVPLREIIAENFQWVCCLPDILRWLQPDNET